MTKTYRWLAVVCAVAILAVLGGCFDPEPAEVSMNVTNGGQQVACSVLVFNSAGKQIQEEAADQYGVVYVKDLPPGKYSFKFRGHDNAMYPAERSVEVTSGGSAFIQVELTQKDDPGAGGAPAS